MMTQQPTWKLLENLGDVNPIDHGGYFVFEDETGVYPPEAEYLEAPDDDEGEWRIYRFPLDQCKVVEDEETHVAYLVTSRYAPDWPHALSQYDEWFHKDLAAVARTCGYENAAALRAEFCSDDSLVRAQAYRAIGEYHGFENLDSYPLTLTRAGIEKRYPQFA